jgi:hypothetical protein
MQANVDTLRSSIAIFLCDLLMVTKWQLLGERATDLNWPGTNMSDPRKYMEIEK